MVNRPVRVAASLASLAAEDRDRYFGCLAAPRPARDPLAALHLYDLKLAAVRAQSEERHPALIKLAWWRDAVADLKAHEERGEPLLTFMSAVLPSGREERLAAIADTHMDRVEDGTGAADPVAFLAAAADVLSCNVSAEQLKAMAAGLAGRNKSAVRVPRALRPVTAPLLAARAGHRSPTRRQLGMLVHMATGRI